MKPMDVVRQLKEGTLFYERFGPDVEEFVVLEEPSRDENGLWTWTARFSCSQHPEVRKVIDFAVHEILFEFAPDISLTPQIDYTYGV